MSEVVHRFDSTNNGQDINVDTALPGVEEVSMYDALRRQLSTPADIKPIILTVPSRPNVRLKFNPAIEVDIFQAWLRRATNRRTKKTSPRTLADIVLSNTHLGTLLNGQEVFDPKTNEPLTFSSEELQRMFKAMGPNDAISKMYGLDGYIIQHMRSILDAAGFGDDEEGWDEEDGLDADGGPFENS